MGMFDYSKTVKNIIRDHIKQLPLLVPIHSDHIKLKLYISSDYI
jgi:hypothetical protein